MSSSSSSSSSSAAPPKRVRWSTITIHEFGVGHGGSAVPQTGPSIGLSREPEFTWSTRVGAMARECDGVRRFSSQERVELLRRAGFSRDSVDAFAAEAKRVRRSRALYYSPEMKQLRAQRKRAKAAAKRTLEQAHDDHAPTTTTTKTTEALRTGTDPDLTESKKLRIDAPASTPLAPAALPLSPCVS